MKRLQNWLNDMLGPGLTTLECAIVAAVVALSLILFSNLPRF